MELLACQASCETLYEKQQIDPRIFLASCVLAHSLRRWRRPQPAATFANHPEGCGGDKIIFFGRQSLGRAARGCRELRHASRGRIFRRFVFFTLHGPAQQRQGRACRAERSRENEVIHPMFFVLSPLLAQDVILS